MWCYAVKQNGNSQKTNFPLLFLQNLRIERFWVEVNAHVNYPIKNTLQNMEESGITDTELEATKFFVSNVTLKMAMVRM